MSETDLNSILLCSECFSNVGLKLDANRIGFDAQETCPNCFSKTGKKLSKIMILALSHSFFEKGTITKASFGGAPRFKFNEGEGNSNLEIKDLENDIKLIEDKAHIHFFKYGPPMWMLGEIEPLKALQIDESKIDIIYRILFEYPCKEISSDNFFYRLRTNPKKPSDKNEYDSPPIEKLGEGRFDTKDLPILYTSENLDTCIHECRAMVDDILYVAKLKPIKKLNLIDLTDVLEENGVTEFESLDIAVYMLFSAGKHSYGICRDIAKEAEINGFDGLIFPSYFSYAIIGAKQFETAYGLSIRRFKELKEYAKSQVVSNIALFGRPIKENKLDVECINRIVINKVFHEISFGPAL